MATPRPNTGRGRLVHDQHTAIAAGAADGEVTARQAATFAALVADANYSAVDCALEEMGPVELRRLTIALVQQINAAGGAAAAAAGDVADAGPDGVCAITVATAVTCFGTTRDAVLSADRHRAVTDARAVAMTAARRCGLTLPAIASYFGKNHTSVMYAQSKVANDPRLNAICNRILRQLEEHYVEPVSVPCEEAVTPRAETR